MTLLLALAAALVAGCIWACIHIASTGVREGTPTRERACARDALPRKLHAHEVQTPKAPVPPCCRGEVDLHLWDRRN